MQESKRIILLENLGSDNIEQAIIILKENTGMKNANIVKEAEEIVARFIRTQYMDNLDTYEENDGKEKSWVYTLLAFCMITVFAIAMAMIWIM